MAESLFLQLPRADVPARWLLLDTLGNRIGHVQQGSLAEAAPQSKGRRVTALLPAERVTLLHVEVPSRNPQKVLQAVPYMLEDKLAEDVETLHFALGARSDAGQLVAAVGRAYMREQLDALAAAGLESAHLVPDVCAIAPEPETVVAVLEADTVLARFPDGSGFGTDRTLAVHLLRRRLTGDAGITRIVMHGSPEEMDALDAALADLPLERLRQPREAGMLPLLANSLTHQRGLDLLQGEFKNQTPMQEHWRQWRLAAMLLAACLLLSLAQQVSSYLRLRHQAAALDAQVVQLFTQAMPGSRLQTGTEVQQMKQRLAELQGGNSAGSMLGLLDALGTGLGSNPSIQVTAVSYQGGSLQAQLQAADIGALDALKGVLNKQSGVTANLDSVNAAGNQVTGRIVLSGGAS
ncbi:MAG TPA: type II secretion system protein GspL [Gammaproteobacteria bacterium]|nr:type II secretion system protein GspL [Gammaproteobacteria bacterium]